MLLFSAVDQPASYDFFSFIDPAWEHLKPIGQILDQRVHRRIDDVQDHPSRPYKRRPGLVRSRMMDVASKSLLSFRKGELMKRPTQGPIPWPGFAVARHTRDFLILDQRVRSCRIRVVSKARVPIVRR